MLIIEAFESDNLNITEHEKISDIDLVQAAVEVTDAMVDVEGSMLVVESLVSASEAVEVIYKEAEEGMKAGFESAATTLVAGIEAVEYVLGLPKGYLSAEAVAGLEEDKKEEGNKEKTVLAKIWEAIRNTAKKVWEKIVELWNKLVNFINGLFGKKEDTANKVKKVVDEVKEAEKKADKKAEVKDEEKVLDSAADIVNGMTIIAKYANMSKKVKDKDRKIVDAKTIVDGLSTIRKTLDVCLDVRKGLEETLKAPDAKGLVENYNKNMKEAFKKASKNANVLTDAIKEEINKLSKNFKSIEPMVATLKRVVFVANDKIDNEKIISYSVKVNADEYGVMYAKDNKELENIQKAVEDIEKLIEKLDVEKLKSILEQAKNNFENAQNKSEDVDKEVIDAYKALITTTLPQIVKTLSEVTIDLTKMSAVEKYVEKSKEILLKELKG